MTQGAHVFPNYTQLIGTNTLDPATNTLKVLLIATGPNAITWNSTSYAYNTVSLFLANSGGSAVSEVANGNGYTTGGVAISSPTFTQSGLVSTLGSATNPSWTASGSGFTAYYALFYDTSVGSGYSTYNTVAYWDFGGASSVTSGGTFTLALQSGALVTWTSS
jgi:hypothetical protein